MAARCTAKSSDAITCFFSSGSVCGEKGGVLSRRMLAHFNLQIDGRLAALSSPSFSRNEEAEI